jgi:YfiH family protein
VSEAFLIDPVLADRGIAHGFGTRGATAPGGCRRPRQVHGVAIARLDAGGEPAPVEADAILSDRPGVPVAVVTADCVPILLADASGAVVAAVHAGWRGLAAGVVAAAVRSLASGPGEAAVAAIGPHIGPCCYEVDAPVIGPLRERFGEETNAALRPSRPGHHRIDLGHLVEAELRRAGVGAERIGRAAAACTACDARRFESYRRDGEAAGRLVHWVAAVGSS